MSDSERSGWGTKIKIEILIWLEDGDPAGSFNL